ncbi:MAG: hypothetical protein RLZZ127_2606, partial [Planctomycetota bacterium]
ATAAAQDELAEDLAGAAKVLSHDAMIAGWALSATASFAGGNALPTSVTTDRTDARYFPYVIVYGGATEDEAVTAGRFTHARIPADLLPDQAAITAALGSVNAPTGWVSYRTAMTGPSHAVVMLALQQGAWVDGARPDTAENLRFGANDDSDLAVWRTPNSHDALGILHASPYVETYDAGSPTGQFTRIAGIASTTAYGVIPDSMALSEVDGQFTMLPQWESLAAPSYDGSDGNDPDGPAHFTGWREYLYAVVRPPPDAVGHLGRLVRARKVAVTGSLEAGTGLGQLITDPAQPFGFVVDRILSENVIRMVAETRRSAPAYVAPAVDQIRFTLTLLRPVLDPTSGGARIPRQGTVVVGMRTAADGIIKAATTLTPDAAIPVLTHPAYPVTP